MSRLEIFDKCNRKILHIEELLSSPEKETTIDATGGPSTRVGLEKFDRRGAIISSINRETDIARINVQEPPNRKGEPEAHSIIVVRNKYLDKGWSIFDPNGKANFPFKIYNGVEDVTLRYLEVTQESDLNIGNDENNPGYCGTISLIFMVYFTKNKTDPQWVQNWINFVNNVLSREISESEGTVAVALSAAIQDLVSKTRTINRNIIDAIYNLILPYIQQGGALLNHYKKKYSYKSKIKKTRKKKNKKYKKRKSKKLKRK